MAAKKLDPRTTDPWGSEFCVLCGEDDVHDVSNGRDRRAGTPDDVRYDLRPGDVGRFAGM